MGDIDSTALKAVLVGCGGMGKNQVKIIAGLEEYELAGVCDIVPEHAQQAADATGANAYADIAEALSVEEPDVAAVCTDNASHAKLTIAAAEAGVRGVYCEKPMTTNMADGRAMVQACSDNGAALVINHQRRLGPDLVEVRRLIEEGAVGDVRLIRGNCAGDILSDGTHLIDSIMWLVGDPEVEWVFGQVHRVIDEQMIERARRQGARARPGFRFGHPVENGGTAVFQVKDGPRVELCCGDMREEFSAYQDYEVFGAKGRLWRTGDRHRPNLFIQDAQGGGWDAGMDEWTYKPIPNENGVPGVWRPVDLPAAPPGGAIAEGYRRFARMIRDGEPHPMCGDNALRGFEVLMAIYESARLHRKIELPLQQERFPLELMIEAGQF